MPVIISYYYQPIKKYRTFNVHASLKDIEPDITYLLLPCLDKKKTTFTECHFSSPSLLSVPAGLQGSWLVHAFPDNILIFTKRLRHAHML